MNGLRGVTGTVHEQTGLAMSSGGERKRVSIAEATLSGSPIQCWDNSTRGLDSANALEFCKTLNLMTKYAGATVAVAIYQASQNAYDVSTNPNLVHAAKACVNPRVSLLSRFSTK